MWVSVFEDDDEAFAIWRDEVLCSGCFALSIFGHLLEFTFTLANNSESIHFTFDRTSGYGCAVLFCGPIYFTIEVNSKFYMR